MIYDIIGDIHGQADKLIGLLEQLGYRRQNNAQGQPYYVPPPNHRAMFIGDFIDRGPQEIRTLEIVFAMLDAGVADAVMGNHEYNALAFATLDEQAQDGSYLRPHKASNIKQHQAFLDEAPWQSAVHRYWLARFYELPLWLETEHACFVHACWDTDKMADLRPYLTAYNCLTPEGLQATGQYDTPAFEALERVLKGLEIPLPDGVFIVDKGGVKRYRSRVKWWLDDLQNCRLHQLAQVPREDEEALARLPDDICVSVDFQVKTQKPIFIGHYWLKDQPQPLSQQVVCTDYSAAFDSGYLTCYQFDTDNPLPLSADNFVQFNHHINHHQ